jgi:acetyl esterase/lipase
MDAVAALKWIKDDYALAGNGNHEIPVIIWGQSIGAGVASNLAAQQHLIAGNLSLRLLILETPFISIRAMLEALYPQKWLPYKHLWPFLRNHLDSHQALGLMRDSYRLAHLKPPRVLILEAGNDELVPREHGNALEMRCEELGLDVRKQVISNSLHTEIMVRPEGRIAVVEAIYCVAIRSEQCQKKLKKGA